MPKENRLFMYQTEERKYSENASYFNIEERNYIFDPLLVDTLHWHDYFEMEFFYDGRGSHILNGENITVKKGTIHLVTPSDFHTLNRLDEYGDLKYFNVNFNEYALPPEMIRMMSEFDAPMSTEVSGEVYEELFAEFRKLTAEYNSDNVCREMMMRTLFEKIFLIFWRELLKNAPEGTSVKPKRDSNVRFIVSYLRLHFRESVSLRKISKEVHLTPNYIGEIFRRETGMSFTDYVQRLRLNYATNLLVSSDLSIADISAQSGFHSVSYFIRTFRMANGRTPLEYRNRVSVRHK